MAEPTQFEQFQQLLTDSRNENSENYERFKEERKRLETIPQETFDPNVMARNIHQLARQMQEQGLLPAGLDPDRIGATFNPTPYLHRPGPNQERQTEAPKPPTLADFLPPDKDKQHGGGHGGTPLQDQVEEKLRSTQREQVLKEFDNLLATTPEDLLPEALERFYHTHLSAAGVVGRQYQILIDHTRSLYGQGEEFQQHADALTKEAEEKTAPLRVHIVGPLENKGQQQLQRDEQQNMQQRLLPHVPRIEGAEIPHAPITPERRQALRRGAEELFDASWSAQRSRILGALESAIKEFRRLGYGYETILEGSFTQATTIVQEQQYQEGDHIPEGIYGGSGPNAPGAKGRAIPGSGSVKRGLKRGAKDLVEKAGKKVAERAAVQTVASVAAATSETWIPIVLIGLGVILLLFLIIFIVVFLFSKFTSSSTQSVTAITPGSCGTSAICVQKLQQLGINLTGNLSFNADPLGKAQLVYNTLALAMQPPSKYGTLLQLPSNPITIDFQDGGCAGHANPAGIVEQYGFGTCGTIVAEFMLLHELGHEIAFRNPALYQKFLNQFTISALLSYDLPTFNCELDYFFTLHIPGPYPAECFADTVAEYVTYKQYRNTVGGLPTYFLAIPPTFSTFKLFYAPFYNFAKDNIYNGVEF